MGAACLPRRKGLYFGCGCVRRIDEYGEDGVCVRECIYSGPRARVDSSMSLWYCTLSIRKG